MWLIFHDRRNVPTIFKVTTTKSTHSVTTTQFMSPF